MKDHHITMFCSDKDEGYIGDPAEAGLADIDI
jgi:hypothetical protein